MNCTGWGRPTSWAALWDWLTTFSSHPLILALFDLLFVCLCTDSYSLAWRHPGVRERSCLCVYVPSHVLTYCVVLIDQWLSTGGVTNHKWLADLFWYSRGQPAKTMWNANNTSQLTIKSCIIRTAKEYNSDYNTFQVTFGMNMIYIDHNVFCAVNCFMQAAKSMKQLFNFCAVSTVLVGPLCWDVSGCWSWSLGPDAKPFEHYPWSSSFSKFRVNSGKLGHLSVKKDLYWHLDSLRGGMDLTDVCVCGCMCVSLYVTEIALMHCFD